MIEDGATDTGSVTTVRRVGETIRRPAGEWTPAVHAPPAHLEAVGFTRAPRVPGTDGGDESLALLHGTPAFMPWPPHCGRRPGSANWGAGSATTTRREADRVERLGRRGDEPWATFLARGDAAEIRAEQEWVRSRPAARLGEAGT
ncbi:hypothetical protein [Streptomyces sp. I05A-00742]|uniref:hypothetical protein n=1 Tax=Streptomyces sp. I05A-00742 TaxID=2732853 RepID=UPI001BB20A64|nr:hypothetical protein [Streptomyces sp. I05A-00742]